MVETHWFMDTYVARLYLIIYYPSLVYSLGQGISIMMLYCHIKMSDTMVAPE